MSATALTIRSALQQGRKRLSDAGITAARSEVEWLLSRLMGVRPLELYLCQDDVAQAVAEEFWRQLEARASGAPLQYLLGESEFFGQRFIVRPGVFIPRPETEALVEAVIRSLGQWGGLASRCLRLVDVGTGSGCIAVTLARHLPACRIVAVELSWRALYVARQNVQRAGLQERIQLIQADALDAIRGPVDGVVANPPYISSAQVDQLPLDVRREPRMSLDGGDDGCALLRRLLRQAPRLLAPGGVVALECAEDQVESLAQATAALVWVEHVRVVHDVSQRPRGLLLSRTTRSLDVGA